MTIKLFEVRDSGTFIPVMAVQMLPSGQSASFEAELYLLRRAGYGLDQPLVILCRLECSGTNRNATYDPFAWGANGTRTMQVAHQWIERHFDEMATGDVVDVEFILGESKEKKESERLAFRD